MSVVCVMALTGTERTCPSVCLPVHCQPAEGRMLCRHRPPEQAQPSGNVCLSVRWRDGEELGSGRCGLLHPKALHGLFQAALASPRGPIASAIIFFIAKQGAGKKKNPKP